MERDEIKKWMKNKNVIMTIQADPFFVQQLEEWAKSQLQEAFLDWNFISVTQDKSTYFQTMEAIESISFMDSKKVVFLKKFRIKDRQMGLWSKEDFISLAESVASLPENTVVFLVLEEVDRRSKEYKALTKSFHLLENPRLSEVQLHNHIKRYISDYEVTLSLAEISYYIGICNYAQKGSSKTLLEVHQEVEKLLAWKNQGKSLTKEAIANLVLVQEDMDVFRLTDAIFRGSRSEAIIWYQKLFEEKKGSAPILGWINSTLSLAIKCAYLHKDGLSTKQIAAILGVHEFRIKKTMEILRKVSREDAIAMLNQNLDLEYGLKTGNLSDDVVGEIAILKMTRFIKTSR